MACGCDVVQNQSHPESVDLLRVEELLWEFEHLSRHARAGSRQHHKTVCFKSKYQKKGEPIDLNLGCHELQSPGSIYYANSKCEKRDCQAIQIIYCCNLSWRADCRLGAREPTEYNKWRGLKNTVRVPRGVLIKRVRQLNVE